MAEQKCRDCGHGNPGAALYCEQCGKPLHAAERDPLVGQTIAGRYYIVERIGQGSAGILYRAEHNTLRRKMAVKLLHKHLAQSDEAVERFRREAITVCEIDNDHIPQVHDFGRADDGRLFFAMEFLEGEPLSQLLERDGRLSVDRTIDVLGQVADGLMEAHTLGYVHRDLRPRSIFLTRRRGRPDFVKILDFGLAKLVQPEVDAQRTAMGMNYGDPRYMAPEQARGDTVDRRADIYSLGAIGFEMLTGEPPFQGQGTFDILGKVLDAQVPRLRDRRPDCPAWLESVVRVALGKTPSERFQTVTQLLDALERKQVLQTQPAMPAPTKAAVAKAMVGATALRPLPAAPAAEHFPAGGPTQAMPTVAAGTALPPANSRAAAPSPEPATDIRHTLAYPAVRRASLPPSEAAPQPVRPVAAPAAPVARAGAAPIAVPKEPPPSRTAVVEPAAKAAPAKSEAAVVVKSVPAPSATTPSVAASKPAAAKPVAVIKPTTPSRSDPTPRTVSAMLEQETLSWLETAESIFDQPSSPEAEAEPEAPAVVAAPPAPIAKPPAAQGVAKPVVATPAPRPAVGAVAATPTSVKPVAVPAAVAAPLAKAAAPAPIVASPVAAPARPAVEPIADQQPEWQQLPPPVVTVEFVAPLDPETTLPTPKLAKEALEPSGAIGPLVTAPLPLSEQPTIDRDAETALRPKISDDHEVRPAAKATTRLPARPLLSKSFETEETPLPPSASSPPDEATAGWFAEAAAANAEDDSEDQPAYVIPRRRLPGWALPAAGAAVIALLTLGYFALRSPGPTPAPVPSEPVVVTPPSPPPAEAPAPTPPPIAEAPPVVAPPAAPGPSATGPESAPAKPAATLDSASKLPATPPTKPVAVEPAKPVAAAPPPAAKPAPEATKPAPQPKTAPEAIKPAPQAKTAPEATKPAPQAKLAPEAIKPAPQAKLAPEATKPAPQAKTAADSLKAPTTAAKPGSATPEVTKSAEAAKPAVAAPAAKGQEAAALVSLGKKKLDDGEPEAAAQSFSRAAQLDPSNAEAVGGLGEAALEQGDYDEAIRQLQKATRLAPRRTSFQELTAQAQFKLGRYSDAADTCRKLLKQEPGSKRAKQTLELAEKKLAAP